MKRLFCLLTFAILFVQPSTQAIAKDPEWYSGKVILFSGDTLYCDMQFTRKVSEGLLQVRKGVTVQMLTVKDVRLFSFMDERAKRVRTFFPLRMQPDLSTRAHEVFIELLCGSELISVVSHRTLGYSKKKFQVNPFRKKEVVDNQYLYDHRTARVVPLSGENLLMLLSDQRAQIQSYIAENGLGLRELSDVRSILAYHQSLQ